MITIFSPNSNSVEIVRVCEATYKETITKKKFCLGHQIGDEVIKMCISSLGQEGKTTRDDSSQSAQNDKY